MPLTISSSSSATLAENTTGTVYTVTTSGSTGTVSYTISGGADQGLFTMTNGAVTFNTTPNYEAPADSDKNNRYEIIVKATDSSGFVEKAVTIIVTNTASLYSLWTQLGGDIDGEFLYDMIGYSVSLSAD